MEEEYHNYFIKRAGEAKVTHVKLLGAGGFGEVHEVILKLSPCTERVDARRGKSTSNALY
jgi:serine/threonine protein kinase